MNKYLGVEIGGTKQQITVGLKDGSILHSRCVKLQKPFEARDVLGWLEENIRTLTTEGQDITGIGVGFGGPLETETGRILCSLQVPGWKDFQLQNWFERTFHKPAVVINDTVAGGLAEFYLGAGAGCRSFFYTNIGTGIGGGFYLNGKYYDGAGYGASYLGNSWVPDWHSGTCNAMTRLELLCSGRSIEERLNKAGYIPHTSCLYREDSRNISCQELAEGVRKGDAFCKEELDKITGSFAVGLANVLALLAPEKIVIGGGVAKMGEILFSRLRRYTEEYAFLANRGKYEIVPGKLMDDAVLSGALLAAGNRELLLKI